MRSILGLVLTLAACTGPSNNDGGTGGGGAGSGGGGGTTGTGHFTWTFNDQVFRIEARVGAVAENVSTALARFGSGTRDRWLIPSVDGAWLVVSTDRISCGQGECLAITPRDLSSLTLVKPGGVEIGVEGTPAVSNAGDVVIFSSSDGPHEIDLWLTRKSGTTWAAASLLTVNSTAQFNNAPALTFDGQRVLFDCGLHRDAETGSNDSCEVKLDGTGFRVLVRSTTLPTSRNDFVQFPHDSLDGVLFQGSWPIGADSPETIWLLPATGAPTAIGSRFENAVSPCGLRDGRFGLLWLGRPGNASGAHELTLAARDGSLVGSLTPGVDVTDIGIGCSD